MQFDLLARDGRARRGRLHTAHGVIETPVFMPVGTQGAVKALTHRDLDRRRRADHPRQHLSPAPPPRRGPHRAARRPAPVHRLGPRDPHRQRRLSGVQPRRAPEDRGRRRPLQVAPRRQRALPVARERGGHPGRARLGHRDGARRVPGAGRRARPMSARPWTIDAALGAAHRDRMLALAPARRRPGTDGASLAPVPLITPAQAQFGIVQGGTVSGPSRRASAAGTIDVGFEGYAIGGLSVGEPPDVMYEVVEHTAPLLPADRPRYLMGVGHAGGPRRGRRARHRHVRLRAAHPQRPQRPAVHPRGHAQHQERPVRRGRSARGSSVQVLHLPHVFARLSTASLSWPAR